jgi:hypothetical protein
VGGNTGLTACIADCNGDFGGTAFTDNCNTCVGGNTGLTACIADCNGDFGGTAFTDNCGTCVGGNTGEVACVQDCNGDFGGTAIPGSPCDDGDATTQNDVLDANCLCSGTAIGTGNAITLELRTNNTYDQISWEIRSVSGTLVCSGGGYSALINAPITAFCDLGDDCYTLRVEDSAGDGFGVGGGYQLRLSGTNSANVRIIDNLGNFNSGSLSTISGGPNAFCFPMSTNRPLYHHRDRIDFVSQEYLVCEEDLDVSAQWQVGDQTLSGYQFWFFDPNGGYSFRRFRNHATSDGFANVGATRACHMKINNWAVANRIPENVLMNVRIRTRVNGTYAAFGPAYRFKIDPVRALCPLTKLLDYVESQYLSCNQVRNFGPGNWVHARVVPGANRYQFRFRIPAENFSRSITSNTYFLQLNWATMPLEAGKTYVVDVRASKDGGATWCSNFIAPALNPWGDLCNLTIAANAQGDDQNMANNTSTDAITMWPNPNRGDQLWIDLSGIEAGAESDMYRTVAVDIFDMTGKRIMARIIPTQGDRLNTVLNLNGDLATGMYLVNITAGGKRYTERLVITD